MGIVVGITALKARRISKLEAELQKLYVESAELARLETVNTRRQAVIYAQLVKLGARGRT